MINWSIVPLKNYPNDGNYLEVEFCGFVPFKLKKGADGSDRRYWYFYANTKRTICDIQDLSYFIQINFPEKGYQTAAAAIADGMKIYKKWLESELKRIQ